MMSLAFGWTLSANHVLSFKDDNADGVINGADSNIITSSVVWTDGTGTEKIVPVAGSAGGVAIGAVLTPPQGLDYQAIGAEVQRRWPAAWCPLPF